MADIKVYTLKEVADIIKVTRRTLYNYIKDNKLKAVKIGKHWRVSEQSLQEFLTVGTILPNTNGVKK